MNRIALLALGFGAIACGEGRPPATAAANAPAPHDDEHRLVLDAAARARHGLTLAAAGPGTVDLGVELLGVVQPNGDRLAHITPRFPGIVREVHRGVGDVVHAGDVLAIVESSESLAPYELRTLIDGTVIEKHLTRGEAVDRDKQCFVIADLRSVWIDLGVYQKDLDRVRLGDTVTVRAGDDGPHDDGRLGYVTPGVDPTTRTATARVVLPNPGGRWRPGMFVTATVQQPVAVPLAIPSDAVQTVANRPTAFVVDGDVVRPVPLTLGRQGERTTEVRDGLRAGDRVVAANAFLLKAELGKSSAEHAD